MDKLKFTKNPKTFIIILISIIPYTIKIEYFLQ